MSIPVTNSTRGELGVCRKATGPSPSTQSSRICVCMLCRGHCASAKPIVISGPTKRHITCPSGTRPLPAACPLQKPVHGAPHHPCCVCTLSMATPPQAPHLLIWQPRWVVAALLAGAGARGARLLRHPCGQARSPCPAACTPPPQAPTRGACLVPHEEWGIQLRELCRKWWRRGSWHQRHPQIVAGGQKARLMAAKSGVTPAAMRSCATLDKTIISVQARA